jgi:hypothetical protein
MEGPRKPEFLFTSLKHPGALPGQGGVTDVRPRSDSYEPTLAHVPASSGEGEMDTATDWAWYAGSGLSDLARIAWSQTDSEREDLVSAIPVALEGDQAVFLDAADGATVMVIDLEEHGKRRVRRVPASDLEEGTFILLRSAGGGDLIVPVADTILKERAAECRALQVDWKARLRQKIRASSFLGVSIELLDAGSSRANETNLRRWVWERSIRPEDIVDFRAIMRVIGLEDETARYWAAMRLLDRAHAKAGQAIRRLLLHRVRTSDLEELQRIGVAEFDLPGAQSGRMLAARIVKIGSEPVMVSPNHVGRPIDEAGAWLL